MVKQLTGLLRFHCRGGECEVSRQGADFSIAADYTAGGVKITCANVEHKSGCGRAVAVKVRSALRKPINGVCVYLQNELHIAHTEQGSIAIL